MTLLGVISLNLKAGKGGAGNEGRAGGGEVGGGTEPVGVGQGREGEGCTHLLGRCPGLGGT